MLTRLKTDEDMLARLKTDEDMLTSLKTDEDMLTRLKTDEDMLTRAREEYAWFHWILWRTEDSSCARRGCRIPGSCRTRAARAPPLSGAALCNESELLCALCL